MAKKKNTRTSADILGDSGVADFHNRTTSESNIGKTDNTSNSGAYTNSTSSSSTSTSRTSADILGDAGVTQFHNRTTAPSNTATYRPQSMYNTDPNAYTNWLANEQNTNPYANITSNADFATMSDGSRVAGKTIFGANLTVDDKVFNIANERFDISMVPQDENDEFWSVANYLYATQGEQAVKDYIDYNLPRYQQMTADKLYSGITGAWDTSNSGQFAQKVDNALETAAEFGLAVGGGIRGFGNNVSGALTNQEINRNNAALMATHAAAEDGGQWKKWILGAGENIGNNLVPQIFGAAFGDTAAAAMMGFGAYGSAKQDALADGASVTRANIYGIANGMSETLLGKLFNAIPGAGGILSGKALEKFVPAATGTLANSLVRAMAKLGISNMSEVFEEVTQNHLEEFFQQLILGKGWNTGEPLTTEDILNNIKNIVWMPQEDLDTIMVTILSTSANNVAAMGTGHFTNYSGSNDLIQQAQTYGIDTSSYEAHSRNGQLNQNQAADLQTAIAEKERAGRQTAATASLEGVKNGDKLGDIISRIGIDEKGNLDYENLTKDEERIFKRAYDNKDTHDAVSAAVSQAFGNVTEERRAWNNSRVKNFTETVDGKEVSRSVSSLVLSDNGTIKARVQTGENFETTNYDALPSTVQKNIRQAEQTLGNAEAAVAAYNAYDGKTDYDAYLGQAQTVATLAAAGQSMDNSYITAAKTRIGEQAVNAIYTAGKNFGEKQSAVIGNTKAVGTKTNGSFDIVREDVKVGDNTFHAIDEQKLRSDFGERGWRSYNRTKYAMKTLSKALKLDIRLYDSRNSQGQTKGAQGAYINGTRTIYLDIFAYDQGGKLDLANSAVTTVLSHELTHFMQQNDAQTYAELKAFVFDKLSQSENFSEMLAEALNSPAAQASGDTLGYAMDEMVAHACENMLTDSKSVAEMIREAPTLAGKVKAWIDGVLDLIRGAAITSPSAESSWLANYAKELQAIWDKGIANAVKAGMTEPMVQPVVAAVAEATAASETYSTEMAQALEDNGTCVVDNAVLGVEEIADDAFVGTATEITNEEAEQFKADDNEYLELAKEPEKNRSKLAEIVKKAAEAAGYVFESHHGTTLEGNGKAPFTVFNKGSSGFYTASVRQTAENFAIDASGKTGYVFDLYAKFNNPFVVDANNANFYEIATPDEMKKNGYGNDATTATDSIAWWAKEHGYDGIIVKNVVEGDGTLTDDYVAFSSEQLKSADPVTYDDNGNAVPISQRFNEKKVDIRFSSREDYSKTKVTQPAKTKAEAISKLRAMVTKPTVERNENGEMLVAKSADGHTLVFSEATWREGGRDATEQALRDNGHTPAEIAGVIGQMEAQLNALKQIGDMLANTKGYTKLKANLAMNIAYTNYARKQVGKELTKAKTLSSLVNNGDYPLNFDLSLSCKKRVAYGAVMNRLLADKVLDSVTYDAEAIAKVNEILRDNGFETACLGCFVESRRLQFQEWAETVVNEWNREVDKFSKDAPSWEFYKGSDFNIAKEDLDALDREWMSDRDNKKLNDKGVAKMGSGSSVAKMNAYLQAHPASRKKLTTADLLTADGLKNLKATEPGIFSIAKSRYGAAAPKIVQDFNPYSSEIASLSYGFVKEVINESVPGKKSYVEAAKAKLGAGKTPAQYEDEAIHQYVKDIGGLRIQSFSDFMIENTFDMLQILADTAARKFHMHGYTKEQMCMRLFGMSGQKWNGSWIAHNEIEQGMRFALQNDPEYQLLTKEEDKRTYAKKYAGLMPVGSGGIPVTVDGMDFEILMDDVELNQRTNGKSFIQSMGMRDNLAVILDPRYSSNCGNITIGVSDLQIRAMLNNPLFRMVIPYHKSGMSKIYADMLGIGSYNDYTDQQNTTINKATLDITDKAALTQKGELRSDAKVDTSFPFNKYVQELGSAKAAADYYLAWCADKTQHPVTYKGKVVGYTELSPKFSTGTYDFTQEENYYKLLEDFNTYDTVAEISQGKKVPAQQNAVKFTIPSADNRLTAQQMEEYKQRLRDTGVFSEEQVEKYAKLADMTFDELCQKELEGRAKYEAVQNEKFEGTVQQIKDALGEWKKSSPEERQAKRDYKNIEKDLEAERKKLEALDGLTDAQKARLTEVKAQLALVKFINKVNNMSDKKRTPELEEQAAEKKEQLRERMAAQTAKEPVTTSEIAKVASESGTTAAEESIAAQFSERVRADEELTLPNGKTVNKLKFLNEQLRRGEVTYTYKSFLKVVTEDGKVLLYPPMATKTKGDDGKYRMANVMAVGEWEQSIGNISKIKTDKKGKIIEKTDKKTGRKYGEFDLVKDDGGTVPAAYNPYQHSSNLMINDQFEAAHRRPGLVTYKCAIPNSELTSGYWAEYAKDPVGRHEWHAGVVAGQLSDNTRDVYLSRFLMPVEEVSDADVAKAYKELLEADGIKVPFNVVTPSLLSELKKIGVPIDERGTPMYRARNILDALNKLMANNGTITTELGRAEVNRRIKGVDADIRSETKKGNISKVQNLEVKKAALERLLEDRTVDTKENADLNGTIQYYLEDPVPTKPKKPAKKTAKAEKVQFSYRGEHSKLKNDNLDVAKAMESEGKDSETIRLATGWFKGYDGKWRYEMDDSKATLKLGIGKVELRNLALEHMIETQNMREELDKKYASWNQLSDDYLAGKMTREEYNAALKKSNAEATALEKKIKTAEALTRKIDNNTLTLADIFDHPKLFKAYPNLKNVKVRLEYQNTLHGAWGLTDSRGISIAVDRSETEIRSTLMHEIQHMIQFREHFAIGSSPQYWAKWGAADAPNVKALQAELDTLEDKLHNFLEWNGNEDDRPDNAAIMYAYYKRNLRTDKAKGATANIKYDTEQIARIEGLAEQYGYTDLLKQYLDTAQELEVATAEAKNNVDAFGLYQRTAGEVESRDVQARLDMSAKERKKTRPDIDRKDVVFATVRYSERISDADIKRLRTVATAHGKPRVSINEFTDAEVAATWKWATNFYERMGTHSPFFRRWFGDWRAKDTSGIKCVPVSKGIINENNRIVFNSDMGTANTPAQINITSQVIGDSKHYAAAHGDSDQIGKVLAHIDEIVEQAVLLDTVTSEKNKASKKGSTQFMHYLYCPITVNGAPFLVKVVVEEYGQGELRGYNVHRIKMSSLPRSHFSNLNAVGRKANARLRNDEIMVSQLYDIVKAFDSDFAPNTTPIGKIDKDGTPKIFKTAQGDAFENAKGQKKLVNNLGTFMASQGAQFSERDNEYLELAKDPWRNRAELTKAVSEAATEWGAVSNPYSKDMVFYHGTKGRFFQFENRTGQNHDGFARLGSGHYFAATKRAAEFWAKQAKGDNTGKVMPVYIKGDKLLNAYDKPSADIIVALPNGIKADSIMQIATDLSAAGIDSSEFFSKLGYDGIVSDKQSGKAYDRDNYEAVIFKPENIKSAEAVTYDDNGNVIPLSERFDSKNVDIRFSERIGAEESFTTPYGVEVIKVKTGDEYFDLKDAILAEYPWLRGTGEEVVRHTYDEDGNEYVWNALEAVHAAVEPYINKKYNTRTNQQYKWWESADKEFWANRAQYSERDNVRSAAEILNEAFEDSAKTEPERKAMNMFRKQTEKHKAAEQAYKDALEVQRKEKAASGVATAETRKLVADTQKAYQEAQSKQTAEKKSNGTVSEETRKLVEETRKAYNNAQRKQTSEELANGTVTKETRLLVTETGRAERREFKVLQGMITNNASLRKVIHAEELITSKRLTNEMKAQRAEYNAKYKELNGIIRGLESERRADVETAYEAGVKAGIFEQKVYSAEQLAKQKEALTKKANERLNALRTQRDAKLARQAEYYRDMQRRQRERRAEGTIRNKIKKMHGELVRMIEHPSENKYIPKELLEPTVNILEALVSDKWQAAEKLNELSELQMRDAMSKLEENDELTNAEKKRLEQLLKSKEFLEGRRDAFAREAEHLAAVYEKVTKNGTSAAYDENVADMLKSLPEVFSENIYDMNEAQLARVYNVLTALRKTIRDAAKLKLRNEELELNEVARGLIGEMKGARRSKNNFFTKTWWDSVRPQAVFERFGGYKKNSMWSKLYNLLNDGQLKVTQLTMELSMPFGRLLNNQKQIADFTGRTWNNKTDTTKLVDIGLHDADGNAILVSKEIAASIYMDTMNEQNARHMALGGKIIPNLDEYYKGTKDGGFGQHESHAVGFSLELSQAQRELAQLKDEFKTASGDYSEELEQRIAELEQQIEDAEANIDDINDKIDAYIEEVRSKCEELFNRNENKYIWDWIKATRKLFDEDSKAALNEVTNEVYGFDRAEVENYFPIRTDPSFRTASFESIVRDASLENAGFMKERINGANPTLALGITDVVRTQIDMTARYCGMMPAVREFTKVYGKTAEGYTTSVQKELSKVMGKYGADYINKLMSNISGSRHAESNPINSLLGALRGNLARATLTLSPRVALSQAASLPTASAVLGHKAIAYAFNPSVKVDENEIAKYTPLYWYRMQGYSTTELGDIKNSNKPLDRLWKKANFLTGWIQAMDGFATRRLWAASKYYVENTLKMTEQKNGEEYWAKVAEMYNKTIEETQPNYTTMQRPELLRNPDGLAKSLTMFSTQRLQNLSIVVDAAERYAKYNSDLKNKANGITEADVAEAKDKLASAVSSQMVQAAAIVAIKTITDMLMGNMKKYRDDDDDEVTAEAIGSAMLDMYADTVIGNFFFGSTIYSFFKAMIGKGSWYDISVNGIDSLNGILEDLVNFAQYAEGDDVKFGTLFKKFTDVVMDTSVIFGMPASNAMKLGNAVRYFFTDLINGDLFTWEASSNPTKKQNTVRLITAMESGDSERIAELVKTLGGEEDAMSSLKTYIRNDYKSRHPQYSTEEVMHYLVDFLGMSRNEAEDTIAYWDLVKENPTYSDLISQSSYSKYRNGVEQTGVSVEDYAGVKKAADTNGNGSVTQEELGTYLLQLERAGVITRSQASAIWKGYQSNSNTAYTDWLAKR